MSQSLWLPFWIQISLLLCAIPTISMLPGTKTLHPALSSSVEDIATEEAGPLLRTRSPSPSRYSNAFETKPGTFQSIPNAVRRLVRLVIGRRNFQVLLISFFLTALASSDTKLLVQYISKRYGWSFAQVSPQSVVVQRETLSIKQKDQVSVAKWFVASTMIVCKASPILLPIHQHCSFMFLIGLALL